MFPLGNSSRSECVECNKGHHFICSKLKKVSEVQNFHCPSCIEDVFDDRKAD